MKFYNFLIALCVLVFAASCSEDDEETAHNEGMITLMFQNFAGDSELVFQEDGSTEYNLENSLEQALNIDLMGYYISEIKFSGEDGALYEDAIETNADAASGFYLVQETVDGIEDNMITLSDVPAGTYNNMTFTLGVSGDIVTEGAQGGILDPANGAWFWTWAVGYVAFKIEGASDVSSIENQSIAYHIGGWGEPNNIKQISLDLPVDIVVSEGSSALTHIAVDALMAFEGHMDIDISSLSSAHSPGAGEHIAYNLESAFSIHHVDNAFEGSHSHDE